MKAMAFKKISVLNKCGLPDAGSHIAVGDLCEVTEKTPAGLYPVTYPTARGKKTRWVRTLQGFLCNQNEYGNLSYTAPGYSQATIKSGGCGVCAAVNAVGALTGKCVAVWVMRDLAKSCGARVSGGTNMQILMRAVCDKYGLKCRQTNLLADVQFHLQRGGVAICNVAGRGMFSSGGHYIVALGMLGGKVCIADSGMYAGKYSANSKRRANVTVSGDLIFAEPAVLDADCVGRAPRYYLLSKGG